LRYYGFVGTHVDAPVIRGGNHTIELRDGYASVRVFKREDVGLEEGARFAQEMAGHLIRLMINPQVGGLIIDVRDAPTIAGPKTRGVVGDLFEKWELTARPVAIVVGNEPIKEVQFQQIVSKAAPRWGRVVARYEDGERWCRNEDSARDQDG
jgi:hypothetical protein